MSGGALTASTSEWVPVRQPQRALLFQFDHVPRAIMEPYERVLGSAKPCRTRVRTSFHAGRRIHIYVFSRCFVYGRLEVRRFAELHRSVQVRLIQRTSINLLVCPGGVSSSLNAGRCAGNPPNHEPLSPSFRLVVSGRFRSAETT
jgi:hypothetical protein